MGWELFDKPAKGKFRPGAPRHLLRDHLSKEQYADYCSIAFFSSLRKKIPEKFLRVGGILIGFLLPGLAPLYLPLQHFFRHLAIIGKTRFGKSTLLCSLILFLFHLRNCTMVIIDKGDLVSNLLRRISRRFEDIILVRVADTENPISINLLQLGRDQPQMIIGKIIETLNRVSSVKLTDRMEMLLRLCLLSLFHWPEATLSDIEPFLFNKNFRDQVLAGVDDPELLDFWQERYPNDEKNFRSSAEGIVSRLSRIIGDPYARRLLCQKETRIPFDKIVNGERNYVLLLDLNTEGKLSPLVADLIARVFLIILHNLALSRPFGSKPIFFFLDEVQTYLEPWTLGEILARGGKYGVHMACAFQFINQLGNFWQAIEGNVGTIISFTAGADDAHRLSRSFPGVDSEEFIRLPRFHTLIRVNDELGTFCFKAKTMPLPAEEADHQDQIIQLSREQYARPLHEVEAEYQKSREFLRPSKADDARDDDEFFESFESLIEE